MRDTTRSGSNGRLHLHGARNVLCLKSVPIDDPPGATSISETPLNFADVKEIPTREHAGFHRAPADPRGGEREREREEGARFAATIIEMS